MFFSRIFLLFFPNNISCYQPRGGWGGTLMFSYLGYVGSGHFLGFKMLNWVFRKKYFLGYEVFVDIFWGHDKIGL